MNKRQSREERALTKLYSVADQLDKNRPDMLISLIRGIVFSFVVFTFLAGIIFTVIPLISSISSYLTLVIAIPVTEWVEKEPVTGPMTMFLFYASGAMLVFYIMRNHFHLLFLWFILKFEQLNNRWNVIPDFDFSIKKRPHGSTTVQLPGEDTQNR
jgi:hypothetical protein